jgi:hypothetical protein
MIATAIGLTRAPVVFAGCLDFTPVILQVAMAYHRRRHEKGRTRLKRVRP